MAWFRNHYVCSACEGHWIAEATEALDAHCPHCRVYDVTPYRSDDLALITVLQTVAEDDLVDALKAAAVKMRGAEKRPRKPATARVVLH